LEEVAGGSVQVAYVYGSMLISQRRPDAGNAPVYYGYDGHGNVTFVTDASGAVTNTYDCDAFGVLIASTGSVSNTRLFAGKELDPDLGLINLRARQYRADTGRFTTRDIEGTALKSPLNGYLYTTVDPVNAKDPVGRDEFYEEYALSGPTRTIAPNIATKARIVVQIGSNDLGEAHAFRHIIEETTLTPSDVEFAVRTITQEILDSGVIDSFGSTFTLDGYNLGFSAFFRTAVLLNIGKIIVR
jgi:RHS repeat-associated protein